MEREKLRSDLQKYVCFLSQGDLAPADAFLLLGNPDAKTFFLFANQWKMQKKALPIVVAGGRGRGTVPLIFNIEKELKKAPKKQCEQTIQKWIHDQTILESDLLEFILKENKIPSSYILRECNPSSTTKENFIHSKERLSEIFQERSSPSVAIVTTPPLLLRAAMTAKQIWNNSWTILRWKTYEINVENYSDDELIALSGYLAGYPKEFVVHFPELNSGNELIGYQYNGGEVSKEAWEILNSVKCSFANFLTTRSLSYDAATKNLIMAK